MDSADKEYTVTISDEAGQMLVSHSRLLAQVSESAAFQLMTEFEHETESLKKSSRRNP